MKLLRILGISCASVLTFLLFQPVNAAVILLEESRSVEANASIQTETLFQSDSQTINSPGDFSDFNEMAEAVVTLPEGSANSSSDQMSQINTTSISASGSATASAELTATAPSGLTMASALASSNLSVRFLLTTPQLFSLSGVVTHTGPPPSPGTSVSLRNEIGTFDLSFSTGFFTSGTTPFDLAGTLFPDTYILSALAITDVLPVVVVGMESSSSDFTVNLQLSEVPIPPALYLFGTGLLGLIGVARRKKG